MLFCDDCFLGYVKGVNSNVVKLHFPNAKILRRFNLNGVSYPGASIGSLILIEGSERGFVARIEEIILTEAERKKLSERAIECSDTIFHPIGVAQILLSFDLSDPLKLHRTAEYFPSVGDKAYSCSPRYVSDFLSHIGDSERENIPLIAIGKTLDSNIPIQLSATSLFCRHCAILGSTGGGKSWTLAHLIAQFRAQALNKVILIDATGEYSDLPASTYILGRNAHIDYSKLSNSEFCFLLAESSPNTTATLCNAIDSLKLAKILNNSQYLIKAGQVVSNIQEIINENHLKFHDAPFELIELPTQIRNECVHEGKNGKYESDDFKLSYCSALIARVENLIRNGSFTDLFGLNQSCRNDLFHIVDNFFNDDYAGEPILRLDFSSLSYDYCARELAVELMSRYLLKSARSGRFKESPILLAIDEAHQFLNRHVAYDTNAYVSMTGVNQIAKEGRKYGLFLCLATQMPRDIPVDVMSQMGTFIIHRLINEADRTAVSRSCSSSSSSTLDYLPMLGPGEALITGVEFPMPMLAKITMPRYKPNSCTPLFDASPW